MKFKIVYLLSYFLKGTRSLGAGGFASFPFAIWGSEKEFVEDVNQLDNPQFGEWQSAVRAKWTRSSFYCHISFHNRLLLTFLLVIKITSWSSECLIRTIDVNNNNWKTWWSSHFFLKKVQYVNILTNESFNIVVDTLANLLDVIIICFRPWRLTSSMHEIFTSHADSRLNHANTHVRIEVIMNSLIFPTLAVLRCFVDSCGEKNKNKWMIRWIEIATYCLFVFYKYNHFYFF